MKEKEEEEMIYIYRAMQEVIENVELTFFNAFMNSYKKSFLEEISKRTEGFPEKIRKDLLEMKEKSLEERMIKIEKDFQIFMEKSREIFEIEQGNHSIDKVCQALPNNIWVKITKPAWLEIRGRKRTPSCPDEGDLKRYTLYQVCEREEREVIKKHLEKCSYCSFKISNIRYDRERLRQKLLKLAEKIKKGNFYDT